MVSKITIKINFAIWFIMFFDSLYMMYSKYVGVEIDLRQNGVHFSKILLIQAVVLLFFYIVLERFLFRKSRVNKYAQVSPKKISVPLYIITILGLAFAQSSILWGEEAFKASGNNTFIFALYGIGVLFTAYSFPWKWRVTAQ